jgi:hypothetical protein
MTKNGTVPSKDIILGTLDSESTTRTQGLRLDVALSLPLFLTLSPVSIFTCVYKEGTKITFLSETGLSNRSCHSRSTFYAQKTGLLESHTQTQIGS